MEEIESYYFGCVEEPGHHLFDSKLKHLRQATIPFDWRHLDTGFLHKLGEQVQGQAQLTQASGWTVFAFWDRSVDSRPGSHSTFLLKGTHDFRSAKSIIESQYPKLIERYGFDITQ